MYYRDVFRILGYFFIGFSLSFTLPLALAVYYEFFQSPELHPQPHTTSFFVESILICVALALIFLMFGRNAKGHIFLKEGLAIVVLIWFLTPAIAALPFFLSGTLKNPFQAYFEACSGLTTTGSSVMQAKHYDPVNGEEIPIKKTFCGVINTTYEFYGNIPPVVDPKTGEIVAEGVEAVSKAILFWRSLTNWLGGGGIVVLFVAILPLLGIGGKILYQAEVAGPNKEALTPRIKETAINLWKIYLTLSVLEVIFLMATNTEMEWLDAITVTFSTISTGGFSIRNTSIAYYQNSHTEWVVIVFMILGSINFALYYHLFKGKAYRFYEPEFFLFMLLLVVGTALIAWNLLGKVETPLVPHPEKTYALSEAIRSGAFQLVSSLSTTGFSTANYDTWPYIAQAIMWIAMYFGGMSGSTSGGIKTVRLIMLFKIAQNKVESLFRPDKMTRVMVSGREIDPSISILTLCFFLLITSVSIAASMIYIAYGIDPETSIGLVACLINGVGLSFRMGAPGDSLAFLNNAELILSSLLMLLGRLEFFAVFALLVPSFWKN